MSISKEELKKEKEYLNKTISVINELIEENGEQTKNRIDEINEMKRYIWENNGELDDAEIASGMYNVNLDVDNTNDKIKELYKLKKALSSPYFGRIDFETKNNIMKVYIGLNGISKDFDFYVFDWRSPIAGLFYNYEKGKASYDAPMGRIDGDITLKRQYKISDSKLERCFDSSINIDDDYLQEILSNASSDKMTNIVNTIQKEQNEIIRNEKDKYLVVQGIAGSGKTSVALHRIAYLLYKEKNLKSNNVLIFSPNEVFSEYISNVLPELGEENVLQTTFTDFAGSYLRDYKQVESFVEFIERYYKTEKVNEEEFKNVAFKISDNFKALIDKYLQNVYQNIEFTSGIKIGDFVFSKNELNDLLKNRFNKFPILKRIKRISEYVCTQCGISYNKKGSVVKEKIVSLLNRTLEPDKLYLDILNSDEFKKATSMNINNCLNRKKINYEDLLPLLYITFEINGYPNDNSIKHIVIDEAQDYTMLQVCMLKKIFPKSSFTILGDINQTINPYYIYKSLNDLSEIFDNKINYIELLKTYRSSEEIIEYTNEILGINNACSIRRNNNQPVIFKDADEEETLDKIKEDLERMHSDGIKRIAIITKNNFEAEALYNRLISHEIKIDLITNSVKNISSDLVILPSYIAKGLEFDGVISYVTKDNPYYDKDKYLFYVVCTRAQHSLTVYNQKKLVKEKRR